jgi:transcriptional regulator with XRE-family HTH domain
MPEEPSARFVANLRLLMAHRSMNGSQLAKALSKKPAWVSQLLSGNRDTPTKNVEAIARVLRVPVERLWLPDAGFGGASDERLADYSPLVRNLLDHCERLNEDGIRRLLEQAELLEGHARYVRRTGQQRQKRGARKGA